MPGDFSEQAVLGHHHHHHGRPCHRPRADSIPFEQSQIYTCSHSSSPDCCIDVDNNYNNNNKQKIKIDGRGVQKGGWGGGCT